MWKQGKEGRSGKMGETRDDVQMRWEILQQVAI
jgi:hypothetical protein